MAAALQNQLTEKNASAILEWVQDISAFFWSEDEINVRLDKIMRDAFAAVWGTVHAKGSILRTAAFFLGCEGVLQARKLSGLYP